MTDDHPGHVPAWRRPTRGPARWPVALAIVIAAALQLVTPSNLAFDPHWLLPSVELALLAAIVVANPFRDLAHQRLRLRAVVLGAGPGWPGGAGKRPADHPDFLNAAAFSPTDTLPLSRWAKLAMMAQAGVSITVVALVIARAVNILA